MIVLSLVGSWLMVRPSPSQRRAAALRSLAIKRGFRVQIAMATRSEDNPLPQDCVEYSKAWPKGKSCALKDKMISLSSSEPTFPEAVMNQVVDYLNKSSIEVLSIHLQPSSMGFVWQENARPEELAQSLERFDKLQIFLAEQLKEIH
jgi:hypothetical protein